MILHGRQGDFFSVANFQFYPNLCFSAQLEAYMEAELRQENFRVC